MLTHSIGVSTSACTWTWVLGWRGFSARSNCDAPALPTAPNKCISRPLRSKKRLRADSAYQPAATHVKALVAQGVVHHAWLAGSRALRALRAIKEIARDGP